MLIISCGCAQIGERSSKFELVGSFEMWRDCHRTVRRRTKSSLATSWWRTLRPLTI